MDIAGRSPLQHCGCSDHLLQIEQQGLQKTLPGRKRMFSVVSEKRTETDTGSGRKI
jgi:hypothetical protein